MGSSKVITPVGGLLSQLPPETQKERQEKIKVNNKKMSELLYLPAYLLPKASDYARNMLSVLSENAKLDETGPKMEPEVKTDVTVDEEMDETEIKPVFIPTEINVEEIVKNKTVFEGIWEEMSF